MIRIVVYEDEASFLARLYRENYAGMETFARRFFRNPDIAQDVVQETFHVAQRKLDDVMRSPSPVGWLYNTLKNTIGDTYRRRRLLLNMCVPLSDADAAAEDARNVLTSYRGTIRDADLQLLIWIYCEGASYAEAALRLGISLPACKKRIQRAKAKMRRALDDG